MNDGQTIKLRQEQPENIRLLAAMRQLYRQGKGILKLLFFLNVVVVLLLAATAAVLNSQTFNEIVALYGVILALLDVFLLTPTMKRHCEQGASIQEKFDCDVLGLEPNRIKQPKDVDKLLVQEAEQSFRIKPEGDLKDWYSFVTLEMNPSEAVQTAQRMNIYWDEMQKKRWRKLTIGTLWFVVIVVVLAFFYQDLTTRQIFAYVLPTVLPTIVFILQHLHSLNQDILRLERLNSFLKENDQREYTYFQARQMQDEIFDHRKNNTLILDFVYEQVKRLLESNKRGTAYT